MNYCVNIKTEGLYMTLGQLYKIAAIQRATGVKYDTKKDNPDSYIQRYGKAHGNLKNLRGI
jgi:hypothetical protein